jgi:hypothetical protein
MARKIPVRAASRIVVCMVSAQQEISLADANPAANMFLQKLKYKHGEQVLSKNRPKAFCFDVLVEEKDKRLHKCRPSIRLVKQKAIGRKFPDFLRHRN